MTVSTFIGGLGPSEIGIKVSADVDSSKQRDRTARRRVMWMLGCYKEVLKEERFCLARFKRIWFIEVILRVHLYCWTWQTIIQMSRLHFKRQYLLRKSLFFVIECFYILLSCTVRRVRKIAKSGYYLRHVHPSAWNNSALTGQISVEFGI